MAKDQYVAVLPDGTEHFGEWEPETARRSRDYDKKSLCEEAVRKAGIKSPRANPITVKVQLFRLEIQQGQLKRISAGTYDVQPPLERMTDDEYNAEMAEILKDLPDEFKGYVRITAYEDGHSAGYEEVVNLARSMAHELKPYIEAYTKRIKG